MRLLTLDPKRTHESNPECPSRLVMTPDGRNWQCVDCGCYILMTRLEAEELPTDDTWMADEQHQQEREIRRRLQPLPYDDDGDYTHLDPQTGIKHLVCDSCGRPMTLEDFHSGGECNLCHAMSKDD